VPARLHPPDLDADLDAAARAIEARAGGGRPLLVALDGRSGTGKSTLARLLAERVAGAVIEGDDFFAGGVEVRRDSPRERALSCIDWRRQREVLLTLRAGRPATWRAFDWEAFDGRLCAEPAACEPARVVLLEGVYSGRPGLADLLDLRLLLTAPPEVRRARLLSREGALGPWELQWHEAEDWYFGEGIGEDAFDLVLGRR
jgi:uridine kinase